MVALKGALPKDTKAIIVELENNKTWLFVPATKMALVAKAFKCGADSVIVDLEDTVNLVDKASARAALKHYYNSADYCPVWVRINQSSSPAFAEDIKACRLMPNLAGVILAKAEQAADIEYVYQVSGLPVIAQIESVKGLYHMDAMVKASGLVAFSYGFLDLCNNMQVQVGTPAADIVANQIRYQLILTSKVHGLLAPIDTVYPDFKDSEGLSQRVRLWSQMGMSGMLCIHPNQVAIVKDALQPTTAELDFAKRVIEEYERSSQAVFEIDGNMVDGPVIERCYQLLSEKG